MLVRENNIGINPIWTMLKFFRYERDLTEFPSGRHGNTPRKLMELHWFTTKEKVAIIPGDFLQAMCTFCHMNLENIYSQMLKKQ